MILYYKSTKDQKILSNERLLYKNYKKVHADKIKSRLTELKAANNLNEISTTPPPRRHKLGGGYDDCWGIDYSPNYRIIIKPCGTYDINDLTTITEIKILALEDYH
ncbi:hypothetical protein [Clostridium butyricum]